MACTETKTEESREPQAPAQPTETQAAAPASFEIEIWKEEAPPCADPDGGAPLAAPALDGGAPVDVLPAVRGHVRGCYDELLARDPAAQGQLVEQIRLGPTGDVCAIRPTLRVGLSASMSACVEQRLKEARFEGVASPLYVPLTYAQRRRGGAFGPPSRIPNLHACGKSVSVPTEATFAYTADADGRVGDLKVDPWKGDQEALGCAANAVSAAPHAPLGQYVAKIRFHP